jgi:large subunit ribosomal protein L35
VPKQKTNSAAKKRFKVSGAGKLLRRHAMQSPTLEKKSAKRKRGFRRAHDVAGADARDVKRLLGR